jgi:hypothetical protein
MVMVSIHYVGRSMFCLGSKPDTNFPLPLSEKLTCISIPGS